MQDPITSLFQSQCINIKDLSRQCYWCQYCVQIIHIEINGISHITLVAWLGNRIKAKIPKKKRNKKWFTEIIRLSDEKKPRMNFVACKTKRFRIVMFNATFNNIAVISWQSVLLVEETGVPGENHRPAASHWQTLSHNVVLSTSSLSGIRTNNASGDRHWLHR